MGKRSLARTRRVLREAADDSIRLASTEELINMRFELGREINARQAMTRELSLRHSMISEELKSRDDRQDNFRITDHALLRYISRVQKIDLKPLYAELNALALRAAGTHKGGRARATDPETGITLGLNMDDRTVSTVFFESEIAALEVADGENR